MVSTTVPQALQALGEIRDDAVYPLSIFMRLAGLSQWAMRQARRNGLKIRRQRKRAYVRGRDWSEYLATIEN